VEYEITYDILFERGIGKHRKSGNRPVLAKINTLLNELREHPKSGTGRPEQLKHGRNGQWSRRINGVHRLVYTIDEEGAKVTATSCFGHYDDR